MIINTSANTKNIYREFSLTQVQDILKLPSPDYASSNSADNNEWAGLSYEATVKASVLGLPEVYQKLNKETKVNLLDNEIESILPVTRYDSSGGSIHLDRYIEGEPECFQIIQESESPNKIINILINISASGCFKCSELYKRGLLIGSIVNQLQIAGYSVGLYVGESVNNSQYNFIITLKEPGKLLDTDLMYYYISHPSVLRRIAFRLEENEPIELRRKHGFLSGGGYGYPSNFNQSELADNLVIIPKYSSGFKTEITKAFKSKGITLNNLGN